MKNQNLKIKRALISVSDKSSLDRLSKLLHKQGVEIISTGGTSKYLSELDIPFTPIEKITGNPEAFSGRIKTISFNVLSGILYNRDNENDVKEAEDLNISPIDLVVCNLYPFEKVVEDKGESATIEELIENIDIGGPTMIRAAAKNYNSVAVLTDPSEYDSFISELESNSGEISFKTREMLALSTFKNTSNYDSLISAKLQKTCSNSFSTIHIDTENSNILRYGENPHQEGRIFKDPLNYGLAHITPIQGKALSYNNYLDSDAAIRCINDLTSLNHPKYSEAVSIIKHLNPCGASISTSSINSLEQAWSGDPISSFGSIICFSGTFDKKCAIFLSDKFVEVIIASNFEQEAKEILKKKKNLRVIEFDTKKINKSTPMIKSISGGYAIQEEDQKQEDEFQSVTNLKFPDSLFPISRFGTMITKHLRSNAISLVREKSDSFKLIGAGMGNPNRLISFKQAIEKAHENGYQDLSEMVLISDAFFPFSDNIDLAHEHGIKNIVQPGGSIKDKEVIEACNKYKITMALTGTRHFRH